ncbi:Uncharacterised protein [Mycobacteroides abscessus subsp. abscessus]|nr:Uncharacterised protein [Mycobacteroides abscessus subsp. abscessus]
MLTDANAQHPIPMKNQPTHVALISTWRRRACTSAQQYPMPSKAVKVAVAISTCQVCQAVAQVSGSVGENISGSEVGGRGGSVGAVQDCGRNDHHRGREHDAR